MSYPTPSHLEQIGPGLWAAAMTRWLTGPSPAAQPTRKPKDQEMENPL